MARDGVSFFCHLIQKSLHLIMLIFEKLYTSHAKLLNQYTLLIVLNLHLKDLFQTLMIMKLQISLLEICKKKIAGRTSSHVQLGIISFSIKLHSQTKSYFKITLQSYLQVCSIFFSKLVFSRIVNIESLKFSLNSCNCQQWSQENIFARSINFHVV